MLDDISIKLTPYLARSKNLIEYFIIIGIKEENLLYSKNILEDEENINLTILSIIESNCPIKGIDLEDIIKRTYPEKPRILKVTPSKIDKSLQSIVFSSCFNAPTKDKKTEKIFYSCYALKFHEKFKDYKSNEEYYIPKAFLIISEYPYFATFYNICLNLYKSSIKNETPDKPIERASIFNIKYNSEKKDEYYIEDNIPIELFIYCLVNYIPSPMKKSININIFGNEDKITIPKLSGYPYADFDLYKALNQMSINSLIKSYLFHFLEFPILIFSSDLTKLSTFMFSLIILNYPLTNSTYLEHLKIISKDEMEKGVGAFKTFLGVSTDFNNNLNFSKYAEIFLIDIENKKLFKKNESNEIKKFFEYINNILNNKKDIKSYFLSSAINLLKSKLESIKNLYNKKAKYQSNGYYCINEKITDVNVLIQESFYEFILNVLVISNKEYQIDKSCSFLEKRPKNVLDNLSEEENIFMNYFRNTDKYSYYYNNFIKEFDCLDELKISLLFCKEFAHLRKSDKNNQIPYNINYFKIIDNFYSINNITATKDISYNYLFQDFKVNKDMKEINNIDKSEENQLFYLDGKIIKEFLFLKKNKKNLFTFLKEIEKIKLTINSVDKVLLTTLIQNNFNQILSSNFYIRGSFVYIYSIVFPIFSFNSCIFYLANLLDNINKMVYFQRNYIHILLKSLQKYYLVNKDNCQFSELTYENIQNYCDIIKTHLNYNFILPNEEMFLFLKKMLYDSNGNEPANVKNKTDNRFEFKYDKIENYVNKIKYNVVEKEDDFLIFKYNGKKTEYNLLKYEDIFEEIYTIYNDYFLIYNFDIEYLNIKKIIHITINLIYYLLQPEYKEESMALFLFKTVIILNKLEGDINKYKEKMGDNGLRKAFTEEIKKINMKI